MSDIAIKVEGLGKRYRLGEGSGAKYRYKSLRDSLAGLFRRPSTINPAAAADSIWALKDVSFEIKQGEVVGIIGRNGAGKSTLLKILSRITEPTEGTADIHGRVGSLLEVGTGFHPELTGRENIYLNGAILGMRRAEIRGRFDEIVAFAEVEKFIDTPVKHYSSGMQMRLAFAVAAHLEPEILLVDEVLAVGDAAFQKKCMGKIGDVAKEGRTILFVSHNMAAIQNLCPRGLLLDNGRLVRQGAASALVEDYLSRVTGLNMSTDFSGVTRDGSGQIQFRGVEITNDIGEPWLLPNRPAKFRLTLEANTPGISNRALTVALGIANNQGERLLELHTRFDPQYPAHETRLGTSFKIVCSTMEFPLRAGRYFLTLYAACGSDLCDRLRDAVSFEVRDSDYFGTGATLSATQGWYYLPHSWRVEKP